MADPLALMRAASNTGKLADTMKAAWSERTKLRVEDANSQAWELVLRAQIDEVFLVLAHLGEAVLPLGVFNKDFYLQTLGDVKASLSSSNNEMLSMAWDELDAELQYCCCAGLTICAHFSPMPVYRGFGACVLSDWDWGCPDMAYLEEKARKKAIRTVYGVKQRSDPQPTRSVFQDFDQVIQILQVKTMAFFVKRPMVSGFSEQPSFGGRAKKAVKAELDLLEDWVHQIARRGHPSPPNTQIASWGFPYATWTSEFNSHILKSEKDCEALMLNQMDPGRLLHAFVCRRAASLDEHSMFLLLPKSAAESLLCWLEGLPGMTHKIIKWSDLETEAFEKKISKSLRKKIGQVPIPVRYAIRHPNAATRPALEETESSPAVLEHPNTVSPPPYSPTNAPSRPSIPEAPEQRERASTTPLAELPERETQELPEDTIVEAPTRPPEAAIKERSSVAGLKSIHTLRRKQSNTPGATVASTAAVATATSRHPSLLRPGGPKGHDSTNWMIEDAPIRDSAPKSAVQESTAVELPAEISVPARKPVPSVAVQPPADCAELPVVASSEAVEAAVPATASADASNPDTKATNEAGSNEASKNQSPPVQPAAPSDNNYLDLLNKVARGEISPQALGEMLQSGNTAPPLVEAHHSQAASPPPATDNKVSEGTTQNASPLPYPDSPTEAR